MKKTLSLVLSFLMILTTLTALPFNAMADTRTLVSEIEATSNVSEIAVYGNPITVPTINVTTGTQTRFSSGNWVKKNGDDWDNASGTFEVGTYQFQCQLRVDNDYGYDYYIDESASFVVDVNLGVLQQVT